MTSSQSPEEGRGYPHLRAFPPGLGPPPLPSWHPKAQARQLACRLRPWQLKSDGQNLAFTLEVPAAVPEGCPARAQARAWGATSGVLAVAGDIGLIVLEVHGSTDEAEVGATVEHGQVGG